MVKFLRSKAGSFWNGFRVFNCEPKEGLPSSGINLRTPKDREVTLDSDGVGWKVCDKDCVLGLSSSSLSISPPVSLVIQITKKCNLRCVYCIQGNDKKHNVMDLRTVERIIKHSDTLFGTSIGAVLVTGGEPFITPDLVFNVAEIVRGRLGEDVALTVETNGTLINEDIAHRIKMLGMAAAVSLDGPPGTYVEKRRLNVRGGSSHKLALRGLNILLNHKISVIVNVTVDSNNHSYLGEIHDWLRSQGVQRVRYQPVLNKEDEDLDHAEVSSFRDILLAMFRDEARAWMSDSFYCENPLGYILDRLSGNAIPLCIPCGAGIITWTLLANGRLVPCDIFEEISDFSHPKLTAVCAQCALKMVCGRACMGSRTVCLYKDLFLAGIDILFDMHFESLEAPQFRLLQRDGQMSSLSGRCPT